LIGRSVAGRGIDFCILTAPHALAIRGISRIPQVLIGVAAAPMTTAFAQRLLQTDIAHDRARLAF